MSQRQGSAPLGQRVAASRTWTVVAVFVIGTLLTAVGAGIGLPHASKAGWSAVTLVGIAALVLGLSSLGFAFARLIRKVNGRRRLLFAPVLLVVAVAVVYILAIPLAVTVVAPTHSGRTPAAEGLDYRDVTVATRDGLHLAAWYVPSSTHATQPGPAVVLLHGSGSTKSSTNPQAAVFARHGYAVLMVDARGHGDSTGRAMDWGWHGDADVDAAVAYLAGLRQVDPRRIAVVGLSMGGEEAVGAAASDSRIRAVVAEGAIGRGAADLRWLSDVYGWRGAVQEGLLTAQTGLVDVLTDAAPPLPLQEAVARVAPRPILLITAGDRPDELHAASRMRTASPGNVRIWTVSASSHTAGLQTSPQEWEQRVVAFLDGATS